ncbi:MAG TPA: hypothetical protein VNG51_01295 [Ktedonobacteraceae bacterium]|nr:hypothetical protein [Ktedonobacteraceae bacterium]
MPFQRERYPPEWKALSLARREQAGWRCEWCGAEQGIWRRGVKGTRYRVVLTVAHLGTPYADGRPGNKHEKRDCRPENLAALCQACHLRYDVDEHCQHARETRCQRRREVAQAAGQLLLFEEAYETRTH